MQFGASFFVSFLYVGVHHANLYLHDACDGGDDDGGDVHDGGDDDGRDHDHGHGHDGDVCIRGTSVQRTSSWHLTPLVSASLFLLPQITRVCARDGDDYDYGARGHRYHDRAANDLLLSFSQVLHYEVSSTSTDFFRLEFLFSSDFSPWLAQNTIKKKNLSCPLVFD